MATTTCAHEESRIACIECDAPICSNCLVQCPVGFRCKTCNGSAKKPAASPAGPGVGKSLSLCVAVGFGAGWILPLIHVPFLNIFIAFFGGLLIGRWMARIMDPRAEKVTTIVTFGLLIGMSMSPYNAIPLLVFEVLSQAISAGGATIFAGLSSILAVLFAPAGFVAGVLRAIVSERL